jgi:hypothetical protein
MLEPLAAVPGSALDAMGRDAPGVLQHSSEVHQVRAMKVVLRWVQSSCPLPEAARSCTAAIDQ